MKIHTNDFKEQIRTFGRQVRAIISYNNNILEEELYSVTPHYEGNLLKSIMKQLDIECSVEIPLGTIVNFQFGVLVNDEYEMLNFGNYIVYKVEKQEDKRNYLITCYDKMLYTMVSYTSMNNVYPITIKDYLQTICNTFSLTFKNANETFVNYDKEIASELYLDTDGNDIGYTFRDVLDQIAQATASNIIINNNDELEVKYFTQTNDTINEEMLKDVNVKFGQSYEMNTIVLSRAGGADKIYKSYPENLPDEDKKAIEISDNQIMNWNDRDTYMDGILNQLRTMFFYINDFSSTGICYLDPCDIYNIQIGETSYPCVMLNDEINITTGLEELIYTDMPEGSETDYKKADKTDRRINQTYLIVDKQNQKIEGIITQIGDRSEKQTSITQDIDSIQSIVEDLEDLTQDVEGLKEIELTNCVEGYLLELHIYGNNTVFDYLHCGNNVYPANNLYPYGDSKIQVINYSINSEEVTEIGSYELGITDVLRQNGNVCDEYVLEKGVAKVIRRINTDGTIKTNETIEELGEFSIPLLEGNNIIRIKNYTARLKAKYVIKSDYTDVFATKVEMNSSISQTAEEINLEVRKKVDSNEIISTINQSAETVSIQANKINLNGAVTANQNFIIKTDGSMEATNGTFNGGKITLTGTGNQQLFRVMENNDIEQMIAITPYSFNCNSKTYGLGVINVFYGNSSVEPNIEVSNGSSATTIRGSGIVTPTLTQTSLESAKKNFKKFDNALDVINNIDIYKYNLKSETDETKKHIGFIIGDKYKYSKEITSNKNDGVDIYSFVSVCCKAIQEQQEEIKQLKEKINKLEGGE